MRYSVEFRILFFLALTWTVLLPGTSLASGMTLYVRPDPNVVSSFWLIFVGLFIALGIKYYLLKKKLSSANILAPRFSIWFCILHLFLYMIVALPVSSVWCVRLYALLTPTYFGSSEFKWLFFSTLALCILIPGLHWIERKVYLRKPKPEEDTPLNVWHKNLTPWIIYWLIILASWLLILAFPTIHKDMLPFL